MEIFHGNLFEALDPVKRHKPASTADKLRGNESCGFFKTSEQNNCPAGRREERWEGERVREGGEGGLAG